MQTQGHGERPSPIILRGMGWGENNIWKQVMRILNGSNCVTAVVSGGLLNITHVGTSCVIIMSELLEN